MIGAEVTLASMGPRFCKRGNFWEARRQREQAALQWGHAFVSVETLIVQGSVDEMIVLQWGHAFVSVETPSG